MEECKSESTVNCALLREWGSEKKSASGTTAPLIHRGVHTTVQESLCWGPVFAIEARVHFFSFASGFHCGTTGWIRGLVRCFRTSERSFAPIIRFTFWSLVSALSLTLYTCHESYEFMPKYISPRARYWGGFAQGKGRFCVWRAFIRTCSFAWNSTSTFHKFG